MKKNDYASRRARAAEYMGRPRFTGDYRMAKHEHTYTTRRKGNRYREFCTTCPKTLKWQCVMALPTFARNSARVIRYLELESAGMVHTPLHSAWEFQGVVNDLVVNDLPQRVPITRRPGGEVIGVTTAMGEDDDGNLVVKGEINPTHIHIFNASEKFSAEDIEQFKEIYRNSAGKSPMILSDDMDISFLSIDSVKLTPETWGTFYPNVTVMDPDGWRGGFVHDGTRYQAKSWDEPITRDEYKVRRDNCTVQYNVPANTPEPDPSMEQLVKAAVAESSIEFTDSTSSATAVEEQARDSILKRIKSVLPKRDQEPKKTSDASEVTDRRAEYESMKVADLLALAKAREISGVNTKTRKADLIEVLMNPFSGKLK